MIPIYSGWDDREEIGYHTFCSSVIHNSTAPVAICPLSQKLLGRVYGGGDRDGSNAFIYLRFLVPYLMGYTGTAIFADGADMVCNGDIADLWALRDAYKAVQVVKHSYKTKNPRKYLGTRMESPNPDYPRKNWTSLMIINCAHYDWRRITPETVEKMTGTELHRLSFIAERFIGDLPIVWNWLSQEYGENPEAKIVHYSSGIPAFPRYSHTEQADDWVEAAMKINHATI